MLNVKKISTSKKSEEIIIGNIYAQKGRPIKFSKIKLKRLIKEKCKISIKHLVLNFKKLKSLWVGDCEETEMQISTSIGSLEKKLRFLNSQI